MQGPSGCCEPGDVTITPVGAGFRLSRVLPGHTPSAPWWELLSIVATREEAIAQARELAAAQNGRAWFHLDGNNFQLIDM